MYAANDEDIRGWLFPEDKRPESQIGGPKVSGRKRYPRGHVSIYEYHSRARSALRAAADRPDVLADTFAERVAHTPLHAYSAYERVILWQRVAD